jgi:phosphomannomutase
MDINPEVFRKYDIRGIYPRELNEEAAGAITRAFARLLAKRRLDGPIFVGRDVRCSSEALGRACVGALQRSGRAVYDLGVVTTPLLHFAVGTARDAAGGIMITASHNPAEYNGMKFLLRGVRQLSYESGIAELQHLASGALKDAAAVVKGGVESRDYFPAYRAFLCERAHVQKDLTVVVDAGGGAAGKFLPALLECMGIRYVARFFDADGSFSAHPPNPLLPAVHAALGKAVRDERADLGVAFDADADRIVAVDERGALVAPDLLGLLLADALVKEGEEVIADVRVTHTLLRLMGQKRRRVFISRVGTVYIKELMQDRGARFALELSGHYYFQEFFGADSAFLTFVHLLNIVSEAERPLSALIKVLRLAAQSGERSFSVNDWEALAKTIRSKYQDGAQSFVDGVTVEYPDWWFNVRPSATEPLVRLNIEADTAALLHAKEKELEELIVTPS